jgi:hypothetical protein
LNVSSLNGSIGGDSGYLRRIVCRKPLSNALTEGQALYTQLASMV